MQVIIQSAANADNKDQSQGLVFRILPNTVELIKRAVLKKICPYEA